jgi:hypothetical protein
MQTPANASTGFGLVHTTLCNKVCQWLVTVLWFSPGTTTLCNKVCQWLVTVLWFSPGTTTLCNKVCAYTCNRFLCNESQYFIRRF